jgi:Kef-type K+ transport system membrane component KefB
MKLSPSQIEHVFNYIQSFDIKWHELQVELTDHFVSIMEDIWDEHPELSFHQVKHRAEQSFGRNYFKEVEKERKMILQKEYNRQMRKMVADFLKFPKIIGSVLLGILIYQGSFYFDKPSKYITVLFASLYLLTIPIFYRWFKNRTINGERFLAVEISFGVASGAPLLGNIRILLKDEVNENPSLIIPLICLWVVLFLFCITGIHLTNKVVSNIKNQYRLN